jgi:hypothetical protein
MLNFASVAYVLRRPVVAAPCFVAAPRASGVWAAEVQRVLAGESVLLDFSCSVKMTDFVLIDGRWGKRSEDETLCNVLAAR